jgi:sulfhydrogenase subunit delta
MPPKKKPKLSVWKFASCDGCQLSLLDCEDELLTVAGALDVAYFVEASRAMVKGPYDLTLVDGSITTAHDAEVIQQVRRASKFLVALGTCACSGGIQALRNFKDVNDFIRTVYAHPEYIKTLEQSTPLSAHVKVDYQLNGCPINKRQLLEVISAYLAGRTPQVQPHSVCLQCKLKGNVCVQVLGTPCLGPVTHGGCGALCPTYHRGCYGCYGPKETANTASLASWFSRRLRVSEEGLVRAFRAFYANAPEFRRESEAHEK